MSRSISIVLLFFTFYFSISPVLGFEIVDDMPEALESKMLNSARSVIDKYRAIATCLSLFGDEYNLVELTWNRQKKMAIIFLTETKPKPSAAFVNQFYKEVESVELVRSDMRIRDAIGYCKENRELVKKFFVSDFPDFRESFLGVVGSEIAN